MREIAKGRCMILFSENYNSILEPDTHYIPLEKDFSNIELVQKKMNNKSYVESLVQNAYEDLVLSKKYHYSKLAAELDECLEKYISTERDIKNIKIQKLLLRVSFRDKLYYFLNAIKDASFNIPGRAIIKNIAVKFGYKKK